MIPNPVFRASSSLSGCMPFHAYVIANSARFHELTDKKLDGTLTPAEVSELTDLEKLFDDAESRHYGKHNRMLENIERQQREARHKIDSIEGEVWALRRRRRKLSRGNL